jgi:hypothetical protein
MGASHGTSSASGSSGGARFGGGAFGPAGSIGFGQTTTSVRVGSVVRSTATLAMHDLHLGPLVLGAVNASADAVSGGVPGSAKATSTLSFADVTLNGTPLANVANLGQPGPLDSVLAPAGITITRLPDTRAVSRDGTSSRLEVGGVKVTFSQPAQEFTVTWTLGRVQVLARALPAAPAVSTAPAPVLPELGRNLVEAPAPPTGTVTSGAPPVTPAESIAPAMARTAQIVRRTTRAGGMDVTPLAALVALATIAATLARRAFHAIASP